MSSRLSFNSTIGCKPLAAKESFLNELVDNAFKLYLVTPLINFKVEQNFLSGLSADCTRTLKTLDSTAAVEFKLGKSKQNVTLSVTVGPNIVYVAALFNHSEKDLHHFKGAMVPLPFMCVLLNGSVKLRKGVVNFIEKRFICSVNKCRLSDLQLQWLMGIAVNETLRRGLNDGCYITYSIPNMVSATLSMDWESTALADIWERCTMNEEENTISYLSIVKLVLAMHEHIRKTFDWDISSYCLKRVELMGLDISQGATLHMVVPHAEILYALLLYLHSECVEQSSN